MADQLFRKKSLDRVASPESLNDYVRVTNPGVWVILCSIIVLLVGGLIWGIFGRLDTKLSTCIITENGKSVCYIPEDKIAYVKAGLEVGTRDKKGCIDAIPSEPVKLVEDSYAAHLCGIEPGSWIYIVNVNIDIDDGVVPCDVILESVAPMTFVFN